MKSLLSFLIALVLCSSCSKSMKDIPFDEYSSYIQGYFDIDNISVLERCNFSVDEENKIVKQSALDNICYEKNRGKSYRISDGIILSVDIYSDFISPEGLTEVSRKRYEELRDELGDISFNRTLPKTVHLPVALSETIEKIGISVNQDYTAEYKRGADVSGLFTIVYDHPFAVVSNQYQSPADTYRYEYTDSAIPEAVYKEPLAEMDFSSKKALGNNFYLVLNSSPDTSGKYTFTITVKATSGKVLTVTTNEIPIEN